MLEKFLGEQTQKIVKNYKISSEEVRQILKNELDRFPALKNEIAIAGNLKSIYRTHQYKNFIKKTKKDIYYQLRTYQTTLKAPVDSHLSTKERKPFIDSFFQQLKPYFARSSYIIDLGGGMFPASIETGLFNGFKEYVWLDKDKESFNKLNKYKDVQELKNLILYNQRFGKEDWQHYLPKNVGRFDLALMLKLVPVVHRQENGLLAWLAEVPAKLILITGSKEAMVKKENIENRERKVIKRFISGIQGEIIKELELPNEFGYLIK